MDDRREGQMDRAARTARGLVWVIGAGVLAGLVGVGGCYGGGKTADLRRENIKLAEQVAAQQRKIEELEATIAKLQAQLDTARGISEEERAALIVPERIEIVRGTRGEDYDGQPGDDGVTVHFRPVDRDGDALKVAGDVTIEVFDLEAGGRRVGACHVPAVALRDKWLGALMTKHFTIKCPWTDGQPAHDSVTVMVTFVDLLTGRTLTAQEAVPVNQGG